MKDMPKPKRAYRPTIPPAAARSVRIMVAVNKAELLGFSQAAVVGSLSLSAWMRSVCVKAARSALTKNGKEVPFDKRD